MTTNSLFLSLVIVLKNREKYIEKLVSELTTLLQSCVSDYELVIVDNGSTDNSLRLLKDLCQKHAFPNIQVFALTKAVNEDIAATVGLENVLGDFAALMDPFQDDINLLPEMLDHALDNNDVVLARNTNLPPQTVPYRVFSQLFNRVYKFFNNLDLKEDVPQYRLLSRNVVNFILQHPQPEIGYRHIPATGGFTKSRITYDYVPPETEKKRLRGNLDRGISLLVSSGSAPLRAVSTLSLGGAIGNLVYSLYILTIWAVKQDVAPGWVSLSLQQSGMFLMISLVLFVFGEYVLHTANLSNDGPNTHIGQEINSTTFTRNEKLNIEESAPSPQVSAVDTKKT